MIILLDIILAIFIISFAGIGIVGFFSLNSGIKKQYIFIAPVIGYIFTQILFWLFCYFGEISFLSFCLTLIICCLVNLFFFYRIIKKHSLSKLWRDFIVQLCKVYPFFLLQLSLILISSWQYFLIGPGNYYHSGNEDFFDGINGGLAYLQNTPIDLMLTDFVSVIPIQYSSQAFWRILLGLNGVDAFLIQSILNIFLISLGVYWLVLVVFNRSRKVALFVSFWSLAANFYLTTFLNGHIGSMMYGSAAPVFIGLLILWIRKEINSYWLILILLIFVFVHFTYPGPIYFLLIPAVILLIYEKVIVPRNYINRLKEFIRIEENKKITEHARAMKWGRFLVIIITTFLVMAIVTFFIYKYFEPQRIQAILRTNVSWKISLFKEMFPIFWGIYPSGSTGTLSILPFFISNGTINGIALILAIIISAFVFISGIKCFSDRKLHYLFIYTIMFIPFFIMMRYFWGSPYYFYKFLYVNYFIVVIIFFIGVENLYKTRNKVRFLKYITVPIAILGILNIGWNLLIEVDYYQRPYNNKEKIKDFFEHTSNIDLKEAALDVPNWIQGLVFDYIFREKKIHLQASKQNARYLIHLKDYGSVFHNSLETEKSIYDNGLLKLTEKPKDNVATIRASYEPEFSGNVNSNWIGNEISSKFFVLKSSMEQLALYLSNRWMNNSYYVDIVDKDVYILLDKVLQSYKLQINNRINSETFYIQLKTGETSFEKPDKSETIWENEFLKVMKFVYSEGVYAKEPKERIDFSGLVTGIKKQKKTVFIDIPEFDPIFIYLRQFLSLNQIEIEKDPNKAELICRYFIYSPYEILNCNSIIGEKENLIWRSSSINFTNRNWEIELVQIPQNNRIRCRSKERRNIPVPVLLFRNNGDLQLDITNVSNEAKYLRLLIGPGPGIDFKEFTLRVKRLDKKVEKNYLIKNPKTMIDLSIEDFINKADSSVEISLEGIGLVGHSLLPIDDRYLNYNIYAIELTSQIESYSIYMVQALNNVPKSRIEKIINSFNQNVKEDIVTQEEIQFGLGWYPFESYNNEKFRWIGSEPAELLIKKKLLESNSIFIELEKGPGNSNNPIPIDFFIEENKIKADTLRGKMKITIPAYKKESKTASDFYLLRIVPYSINKKAGSDPRVLNFRVFSISSN